MTKKHFIGIADIFRSLPPEDIQNGSGEFNSGYVAGYNNARERMMNALANYFIESNPQFNRSRWFNYIAGKCGPNGGKV